MAISLEKILTISADEWFKITNREVSNYKVKGVHIVISEHEADGVHSRFAFQVPNDAEVVVSYRSDIVLAGTGSYLYYRAIASGTALIPKIPEEKK